jgi:hypothetical protein
MHAFSIASEKMVFKNKKILSVNEPYEKLSP